jgi:hypothetical protein
MYHDLPRAGNRGHAPPDPEEVPQAVVRDLEERRAEMNETGTPCILCGAGGPHDWVGGFRPAFHLQHLAGTQAGCERVMYYLLCSSCWDDGTGMGRAQAACLSYLLRGVSN